MQQRIAIVGAGGRLGAALSRSYEKSFSVLAYNHAQLDIGDLKNLRRTLEAAEFDSLVNCAAQTNVDRCESEKEEAYRLNGDAPAVIAEVCTRKGARLVHVSTDYVFAGDKDGPYVEEDEPRPLSVYGDSKLAGEKQITQVDRRHVIARVSWVFGPDRPSFIDAVITRAQKETQVAAIGDKWSTPSYTIDLATYLKALALNPDAAGVIHVTNAGACSWREYAQHALDCCIAAGASLRSQTVESLRLADMTSFIAQRPANTVLSTARFQNLTGIVPRPWQEAVAEYVREHVVARIAPAV